MLLYVGVRREHHLVAVRMHGVLVHTLGLASYRLLHRVLGGISGLICPRAAFGRSRHLCCICLVELDLCSSSCHGLLVSFLALLHVQLSATTDGLCWKLKSAEFANFGIFISGAGQAESTQRLNRGLLPVELTHLRRSTARVLVLVSFCTFQGAQALVWGLISSCKPWKGTWYGASVPQRLAAGPTGALPADLLECRCANLGAECRCCCHHYLQRCA